MGITSFCKVKLFLLGGRRRGRRPRRPRRLNGGGNKRSGQDRSLQAARSRHFVGRGLDPSGRVRREQSGVLPRRGGFHIRPGRSRHHEPPREGFTPPLRTFQKHTCLFYSIPANSARISALISSTERMVFAPFASAAVHSMRCQPSVRAQYSAAARLRARYSVSFS